MTPNPLPEGIKKRAAVIADKKGWTVQDPGIIWVGEIGRNGRSQSIKQRTHQSVYFWRTTPRNALDGKMA